MRSGDAGDGAPMDGRRARGERRRAALIEATLRVLAREGAAKVTHRSVAAEAGVPPSSAVYYFATLDDLLVGALTDAADDYVRRLRTALAAGADPLPALSGMLADAGGDGALRERVLAEYELTLLAVRKPHLRPVARRWNAMVADVARHYTADPRAIRAAVAASDGLCMEALLSEEAVCPRAIADVLRYVLRLDD